MALFSSLRSGEAVVALQGNVDSPADRHAPAALAMMKIREGRE
jgi:hypothetical protein